MNFKRYSIKKFFPSFFLCSVIGLLISFFSFSETNFFHKILEMLNNRWFTVTLLLAVSILINEIYNLYHNTNIIMRNTSFKSYIKNIIFDIIFYITLFMLIVLIILCILAFIYCKNNFEIVNFSYYNIPLYKYILFFYCRMIILLILIGIIEFFLRWKVSGLAVAIFTTLLIIFMMFGLDFVVSNNMINKLSEFPIFITSYFEVNHYFSFRLEFIASLIQIFFWAISILIVYKVFFIKQQKDIMR